MGGQRERPEGIECIGDLARDGWSTLRLRLLPGPLALRQAAVVWLGSSVTISLLQLRRGDWRDVAQMFVMLAVLSPLHLWSARRARVEVHLSRSAFKSKSVEYRYRDGWSFRVEPERFSGRWRVVAALPSTPVIHRVVTGVLRDQAEWLADLLAESVERARNAPLPGVLSRPSHLAPQPN